MNCRQAQVHNDKLHVCSLLGWGRHINRRPCVLLPEVQLQRGAAEGVVHAWLAHDSGSSSSSSSSTDCEGATASSDESSDSGRTAPVEAVQPVVAGIKRRPVGKRPRSTASGEAGPSGFGQRRGMLPAIQEVSDGGPASQRVSCSPARRQHQQPAPPYQQSAAGWVLFRCRVQGCKCSCSWPLGAELQSRLAAGSSGRQALGCAAVAGKSSLPQLSALSVLT